MDDRLTPEQRIAAGLPAEGLLPDGSDLGFWRDVLDPEEFAELEAMAALKEAAKGLPNERL